MGWSLTEDASNHLGQLLPQVGGVFDPTGFVLEPSWQPFSMAAVAAVVAVVAVAGDRGQGMEGRSMH